MNPEQRIAIDKAAREAAICSYDAHQQIVSPQMAYDFLTEQLDYALPARMPAEFVHDYRRYGRLIEGRNPFITCDLNPPRDTSRIPN